MKGCRSYPHRRTGKAMSAKPQEPALKPTIKGTRQHFDMSNPFYKDAWFGVKMIPLIRVVPL